MSSATAPNEQEETKRPNGKMWYNGSQCTASQMDVDVVATRTKEEEKKCGE